VKEEKINVPSFNEAGTDYVPEARSRLMKKIRSKDTKPELKLRKALWSKGYRYRKDVSSLPGKPDIAIKKYKIAIFIDGEFWHGYHWEEKKNKIKRNRSYWIPKIERNMQRDRQYTLQLQQMGFRVFRFWEHKIREDFDTCFNAVIECIERQKIK
jgi:DNA mismatch endonuclease (patch repair protein)